jgi:hypothetical protein
VGAERRPAHVQNHVVDIHQPLDVGLHAGLLAHLAHGRGPRRLARLDVSARQAPPPLERPLGPLDEQHRTIAKDGGAGATSWPASSGANGLRICMHAPASLPEAAWSVDGGGAVRIAAPAG